MELRRSFMYAKQNDRLVSQWKRKQILRAALQCMSRELQKPSKQSLNIKILVLKLLRNLTRPLEICSQSQKTQCQKFSFGGSTQLS